MPQDIGQDEHQQDHHNHTQSKHGPADLEFGAKKLQQRRLCCDVLTSDRLVRGVQEIGRQHDLPHAQCHNEWGQFHDRHQPAIQRSDRSAKNQATGDSHFDRQAVAKGELPHDD